MVSTLTSTTLSSTYKDDFADSAGFHRILFNSGKALQARELTQLQTILQTQIQRFGSNIFKEGAVVKPGGTNLNQNYEFIKLDTSTNQLPADTSTIIGKDFEAQTSGIFVKILQVVPADTTTGDPDTLYVQYVNTGTTGGTTSKRVNPGEDLERGSVTLTVQTTNTTDNPAIGVGILATILSGIYYVRGNFVFTEDLTKIISKYSDNVTTNIGFKALEQVITATDNINLYDNQGANPNLTAPGADRFRITLSLVEESEVNSDENFIHIATVKDGVIYNAIDTNSSYNIPNEVIATRIKENSGDYIVKPFLAEFSQDSANTHLLLNVSSGVAVLDGYRAARTFPTTLRIEKPTATINIQNESTQIDFGNYVIVDPNVNSNAKGLPNINVFEKLNLRDATNHGGSTIGTARVKSINEDGLNLRFYLFDIQMNSGSAFRQIKSIGTSGTNYFNVLLESSKAVLKEPANNSSLFKLAHFRPKTISDISFAVQRRFAVTASGGGVATLSGLGSNEVFTNKDDWIIGTDSDIYQPSTLTAAATTTLTGGGTGANISGLPPSGAVEVLAYVQKSQPVARQKTLTTKQKSFTYDSAINAIDLFKADIFEIEEIVDAADSNINYASRFELDNGQRDNHYDLGKLKLITGNSAPTGNVSVRYKYFEHGNGDFFSVNSYSGQIEYNQIQRFRTLDGERINLRGVLDFRSVKDSGGEFSGAAAKVNELPQPGTLITSDNEYYLARAAKLVIDKEGIIRYFNGASSFNPKYPVKPENTLGLYDIILRGNTDNDSDVIISKIDHKRHTMKDITNLEHRLDKLEEVTTLNLLEIDTKHFQVLDSSGNDRTKAGFFVDNFTDHTGSSIKNDYKASLDPVNHVLRPSFSEDNIRLIFDSDASLLLGTIRKGDNVYMDFDEALYINQKEASKAVRINPFNVVIYEGNVVLSPASDEWRDVDRRPKIIVEGGIRLNTTNAYNWNNWSWSWGGISTENLRIGSATNNRNNMVNRVVSDQTVLELVDDRVIQTAFLPFMRSRKVFFKATGLRPTTRVFAFLDGFNLEALVKPETFQFYSTQNEDFGNTLTGATRHPNQTVPGTNESLVTDTNGTIQGSFIVPNNDAKRVRTGQREFKILDISVDDETEASSIATAAYTATGYLDTKEATYASTRVLGVQGFKKVIYRNYGGDDGGDDNQEDDTNDNTNSNDPTSGNDPPGQSYGGNDNSGDVEADGQDQSGGDTAAGGTGDASDH
tara:strand:+ start:810 stop:4511 length:3702 start_codon:yes stop_codon:yes gene_type:complete